MIAWGEGIGRDENQLALGAPLGRKKAPSKIVVTAWHERYRIEVDREAQLCLCVCTGFRAGRPGNISLGLHHARGGG